MSILFFHFDGTNNSPNDAYAPEHSVSSVTNVLKTQSIGTYGHWLEQKNQRGVCHLIRQRIPLISSEGKARIGAELVTPSRPPP